MKSIAIIYVGMQGLAIVLVLLRCVQTVRVSLRVIILYIPMIFIARLLASAVLEPAIRQNRVGQNSSRRLLAPTIILIGGA